MSRVLTTGHEMQGVPLDKTQREALAWALLRYAVDNADTVHWFEGDPADAGEAVVIAARLGVLSEFRAALHDYQKRRDAEREETRAADREFDAEMRRVLTEGLANVAHYDALAAQARAAAEPLEAEHGPRQ